MASLGRETSRVRSRESTASNSRPSLMSRAYNSVSIRGSKGGAAFKQQLQRHTSKDYSSEDTVINNPDLRSFDGVFRAPESGCRPKPPAKLSTEQEAKLSQLLTHFRQKKTYPTSLKSGAQEEAATEWEKLRMLSRDSMLRYLRACKWDSDHAIKRLTETIAWRREFGVDNIKPEDVEEEAKSGKETVMGFDNYARPLHYMHPHRNNTKESPRQMKFAVWILEACIDLMPPGVEQLALLINFDSKSRNPTSISNAKLMLYILQNHYVERLGVALCINVPWVFKAFWNAIQAFIDPVTKSKCKFDEGVKDEVPLTQLSAEYGGKVDAAYNHDSYWPDLVKLTQQRRDEMLRRFKEQCNSEIGASEWVIRGGNDSKHKAPIDGKDLAAVAAQAEDKTALGRTEDNKPADAPTTQVSDPSNAPATSTVAQSSPSDPSAARKDALEASQARCEVAKHDREDKNVSQNGHQDDTAAENKQEGASIPYEAFKTPVDTIQQNPLDRQFSHLSASSADGTGVASAAAIASGSSTTEPTIPEEGQKLREQDPATADSPKPAQAVPQSKSVPEEHAHHHGFRATMSRIVHHEGSHRKSSEQRASGEVNGKKDSSSIHLLLFAAARDAAGKSSFNVPVTNGQKSLHLGDLPALIEAQGGVKDMQKLRSIVERSQWSVDQSIVAEEQITRYELKGGEEVAIIPPVSGG
ncbi:unnamed protein product [Sympodiomycopsis kandeliae]